MGQMGKPSKTNLDAGTSHGDHARVTFLFYVFVQSSHVLDRLCSDAELIRSMWNRYDEKEMGSKVISLLVTALKRLVTEKPALLGICAQMGGIGIHSDPSPSPSGTGASGAAAYGLDMAGRVASATVSGVVGMIGGIGGLSLHGSSMKLQWYVLHCSQTCRGC